MTSLIQYLDLHICYKEVTFVLWLKNDFFSWLRFTDRQKKINIKKTCMIIVKRMRSSLGVHNPKQTVFLFNFLITIWSWNNIFRSNENRHLPSAIVKPSIDITRLRHNIYSRRVWFKMETIMRDRIYIRKTIKKKPINMKINNSRVVRTECHDSSRSSVFENRSRMVNA